MAWRTGFDQVVFGAASPATEAATGAKIRKDGVVEEPKSQDWQLRLAELKTALEANNFEVHVAADSAEARRIVQDDLLPRTGAKRISYGGSMTFAATGLYDALKSNPDLEVIDPFPGDLTPEGQEERMQAMRQSLLSDLYITGTNAVTETGKLVNLDMFGNRVAGIVFGPRNVVVLVGRNKIVPDVEAAMARVRDCVAPANATRLGQETPCAKTSRCADCRSPDRICNAWSIIEKSFPKGRIKVIMIDEELGL